MVAPDADERTIVVGCDGTERSDDAVALATLLARLRGAQVVLAGVFGGRLARQDAEEWLAETRIARFGVPIYRWPLRSTSPAQALTGLAEDLRAEMLVIGPSHRGRIGRVVLGSVGRQLLSQGPCTVAVAPRGFAARDRHLSVVGVAYDKTEESKAALDLATELAMTAGAALRVITVDEPHTRGLRDHVTRLCADLPAEVRADARTPRGVPSTQLVKETQDGLDVLVLGSRAYGPVGRVLAGSVSTAVTERSHCAVLVVPRTAARPNTAVARATAGTR